MHIITQIRPETAKRKFLSPVLKTRIRVYSLTIGIYIYMPDAP